MKTIISKITFSSVILAAFVFAGCNKSSPTDSGNASQAGTNKWVKAMNGLAANSYYQIANIENKIYAYSGSKLYSSSNNGELWSPVGPNLLNNNYFSGLAGVNNYLAAASAGSGIILSGDLGGTWHERQNEGLDINSKNVKSIVMDSKSVFIGAGTTATVFRSSDLGNTWVPAKNGLPAATPAYYPGINLLAKIDSLLFACPYSSGIYFSDNNGDNWQPMNEGLPNNSNISSFAASDSFYFASVSEMGLYRSAFNDNNWIKTPVKISFSSEHFVVAQDNTVIASSDAGIEISSNNGRTWSSINDGIENITNNGFYCAVIYNNYVFAVSTDGNVWRCSLK